MKIQLFVPPGGYFAERWSQGTSMPPLGLLYIGAVLEKEGHKVQIVPADIFDLSWKKIRRKIQDFKPEIIGVTSTTENRFQSFKLIKTAKLALPKAITVMGGPHASMAAEDSLKHIQELDIAVLGEAEQTMIDLCQALNHGIDLASLANIKGIAYRTKQGIQINPPQTLIKDLDTLPYPAFHLVPFEKYNFRFEVPEHGNLPAVNIMTSRGCPFNCNFCATPINWGRHVRMRSPENIVEEIEFLIKKYGVKVIFFFDDTFNASPRRLEKICDLIISRKLDIFWKCDIRIDMIKKPLLIKMQQAGLFHLSFGLEAGSKRIRNEIIDKKINLEDFNNVINWCLELNIIPNPFFIFSHPTETWEEAQDTIKIIEQYQNKIEGSIAILHIYPGTPLEKAAKKLGIMPENFTWTKKYRSKIITLPTVQGDVPLFVDRLSWAQISELVFRWSFTSEKTEVIRKIPQIISKIRSFGDVKRYIIMAYIYLKLKLSRLASKN